jgi:hypothetical protein
MQQHMQHTPHVGLVELDEPNTHKAHTAVEAEQIGLVPAGTHKKSSHANKFGSGSSAKQGPSSPPNMLRYHVMPSSCSKLSFLQLAVLGWKNKHQPHCLHKLI